MEVVFFRGRKTVACNVGVGVSWFGESDSRFLTPVGEVFVCDAKLIKFLVEVAFSERECCERYRVAGHEFAEENGYFTLEECGVNN